MYVCACEVWKNVEDVNDGLAALIVYGIFNSIFRYDWRFSLFTGYMARLFVDE